MRLRNGNKEVIAFINPSLTSELKISCQANVISASNHELYTSSRGVTDNLTGSGSVSATVPANGFAVYVSKDISGVSDISTSPATRVIGGQRTHHPRRRHTPPYTSPTLQDAQSTPSKSPPDSTSSPRRHLKQSHRKITPIKTSTTSGPSHATPLLFTIRANTPITHCAL